MESLIVYPPDAVGLGRSEDDEELGSQTFYAEDAPAAIGDGAELTEREIGRPG